MRWRAAVVGVVAVAVLSGTATAAVSQPRAAAAASRPASLVGDFVQQINNLRSTLGLRTLAASDQLTNKAASWSQHMADVGDISHSPNLGSGISGWTLIGENVGAGFDVLGLMQAFINSAVHYNNLVDARFTHVGVGVAQGADGMLYTTHLFMAASSQPAPTPAPTPTPEPEPAPTPRAPRPSTPAPPTTTTVPAPPPPPPPPVPNGSPDRVALVLVPLRAFEHH
jgi:hypothetical protein